MDVYVLILDHGYGEIDICGVYSSVAGAKTALGNLGPLEYHADGYWKSDYDSDVVGHFELWPYTIDENTEIVYPPKLVQ